MDSDDPFATDPSDFTLSSVDAGLLLVGRYRLEALLAHSDDVMTWRAADLVLSRPVLVHVLGPDDERLGWVLQAARRAATVTDSRFLRVLDALEASGQEPWSFVVCEYAVGDSLQTLLASQTMTGAQASFIVHELASALGPLHARGLFHLRLGPDAVIITPNGNVKIVGFLVDAALRPVPGEDALSWSEQEARDVQDLGRLLYAATTGTWPIPPSEPQRRTWGLPPAPLGTMVPNAGAEQVWASPAQVNRAIDPELSAITMAILRPSLGLVGPSLRTADDVADSLAGSLGRVEAEESLEHLVRRHRGMEATPLAPAVLPPADEWQPADPEQPTQQMASVDRRGLTGRPAPAPTPPPPDPEPEPQTNPLPAQDDDLGWQHESTDAVAWHQAETDDDPDQTASSQPARAVADRPRPVPAPPRERPRAAGGSTLGRRSIVLLLLFVVAALVALQVRSCLAPESTQPTVPASEQPSVEESSVAQPEPAAIASAFDFDPQADGGDANENADQAHLAIDGDPATVWKTLTYLNNPEFGGLKPGAGLVLDLGSEVLVGHVTLLLDNEPNALQLMVPNQADPAADRPPMGTVGEWRVVAQNPEAGREVTLTPDEPVTTRWVMVYFTKLPPVGTALYRSGIAEATVNQ